MLFMGIILIKFNLPWSTLSPGTHGMIIPQNIFMTIYDYALLQTQTFCEIEKILKKQLWFTIMLYFGILVI